MKKIVIFSAPSGSGKTTIVKHLISKISELEFSVSSTTRPIRGTEIDGKDYHFVNIETFKSLISTNEFLEYEEVYPGLFYGTLKSEIERIWKMNKTPIFDMDVVGGINLKKIFGESAISIFVKAPSIEILKERLVNRATDSIEKQKERVEKAIKEMEYSTEFDYVIENGNIEKAFSESSEIVNNFLNI